MESLLFQHKMSEAEFLDEYSKCTQIVDMMANRQTGVSSFILYNTKSFENVKSMNNTLLSDIENVFSVNYPSIFWFGINGNKAGRNNPELIQFVNIRRLDKDTRAKLRGKFKYIPKDCWMSVTIDSLGQELRAPFIQKPNGELVFLMESKLYTNTPKVHNPLNGYIYGIDALPRIIGLMPDYFDTILASVSYRGYEMAIPIEKNSAKLTFKARDKEGERRTHLIHNVNSHERVNLKNTESVIQHMRGSSDLTIKGIDVSLIATCDWSARHYKNHKKEAI